MRIKHFAGYGTVNAKKIGKKEDKFGNTILSIMVEGDHEQGLVPAFIPEGMSYGIDYTLKTWLIDKFDKTVKEDPVLRGFTNIEETSNTSVRYDFCYGPSYDKFDF